MAVDPIEIIANRVADIICQRMNLTGRWREPTQVDTNLITGWDAIAKCLGISRSKAVRMKNQLGDAIWQQVENGKVTADKEQLIMKYKSLCNLNH